MRYLLLSAHYRKQLNFTWESLAQAEEALRRLADFLRALDRVTAAGSHPRSRRSVEEAATAFDEAMRSDLNTAAALGAIFELVRALNSAIDAGEMGTGDVPVVRDAFERFDRVLGVLSLRRAEDEQPPLPVDGDRAARSRSATRPGAAATSPRPIGFARIWRRAACCSKTVAGGTRWKRK